MERSLTAGELANLIATGQDITLLDVRRKEDFDQAPETIGGAQWKTLLMWTNGYRDPFVAS